MRVSQAVDRSYAMSESGPVRPALRAASIRRNAMFLVSPEDSSLREGGCPDDGAGCCLLGNLKVVLVLAAAVGLSLLLAQVH